jgi:glycosyltransferase involved in cell wall biosynthesis
MKLSVITVVFNGAQEIVPTLRSVAEQTYPDMEHVVVDGGSRDGTPEIVRQAGVQNFISEPDAGLYDAMNKGLSRANGDYVWFINAGDEIYSPDTAALVAQHFDRADVIYGDAAITDPDGKIVGLRRHKSLPARLDRHSFRHGMVVCHQSLIVRKSLAPTYDLKYKISADIDWALRAVAGAGKTVNTGLILSKFRVGGMSSVRRRASWLERWHILRRHFGTTDALVAHMEIAALAVKQKLFPAPNSAPKY